MINTAGQQHACQLTAPQVAEGLATDLDRGLAGPEAVRRTEVFGANTLPSHDDDTALRRLGRQFRDPLVYVLLAASVVTLVLGELVDAGVILGVVLLNAVIGYVQEARAKQALDALARMAPAEATVVRDGNAQHVAAHRLVPGDVIVLQAGAKVPADARISAADSLEIDESALTGESVPAAKVEAALAGEAGLADRINMAHSGTVVTRGSGRAVVVAIGAKTELGLVNRLVGAADGTQTPLTRKLAGFSRQLAAAIVLLAVVSFLIGVLRGSPVAEMFTAAVALAVGAIPEGLPAAVTIVLAIGVVRMARRNAIVRRLPAVETLGGTTVICTDKTGTLTANAMTVTAVSADGRHYEVTGGGYDPDGAVLGASPGNVALRECLLAGALCNDATMELTDQGWHVVGDPTEGALIVSAGKAGIDLDAEAASHPRVSALPFESERQLMVTVHRTPAGQLIGYVKGAVERVSGLCADRLAADGSVLAFQPDTAQDEAARLAENGLRVLAFARFTPSHPQVVGDDLRPTMTFLGLQAMHDPPRAEAMAAVAACRQAGVEVKMITGDHGSTARAIARDFELGAATVTGGDIPATSDDDLAGTAVFARVSPEQKLRLVELLQRRGHVVAMTGDGVNDAPALRQADIGIAMGRGGTDVAKEAADMVLADDNFATIEAAVEEGRGVFDNLRKFLAWTLPTNIAEGLVILVAVVAGAVLPILPVQILWINMTTAVFLGLTLAFEPKQPGIMTRPPRSPRRPLLTSDLIRRIVLVSVILVAGAFTVFQLQLSGGASVAEARTASMNVFVFVQILYLFSCRSLTRFRPVGRNNWLFGGIGLMAVLQVLITYLPVMNILFHTAPVGTGAWLQVLAVGAIAFLVVETDKIAWRWLATRRPDPRA